jgi:hypothetical protein
MIRVTRRSQTESPLSCTGSGELKPSRTQGRHEITNIDDDEDAGFPGTFFAGSPIDSQPASYGLPLSVMSDSV